MTISARSFSILTPVSEEMFTVSYIGTEGKLATPAFRWIKLVSDIFVEGYPA